MVQLRVSRAVPLRHQYACTSCKRKIVPFFTFFQGRTILLRRRTKGGFTSFSYFRFIYFVLLFFLQKVKVWGGEWYLRSQCRGLPTSYTI